MKLHIWRAEIGKSTRIALLPLLLLQFGVFADEQSRHLLNRRYRRSSNCRNGEKWRGSENSSDARPQDESSIPPWCSTEVAIEVADCRDSVANELAAKYRFQNLGQIGGLKCFYLFRHKQTRRRKRETAGRFLSWDNVVIWSAGQKSLKRVKRDFVQTKDDMTSSRDIVNFDDVTRSHSGATSYSDPDLHHHRHSGNRPMVRLKRNNGTQDSSKTPLQLPWPDPWYMHQWYLREGAAGGWDMRVRDAWRLGYSGKNVSVSILDDGIQPNHPDLRRNYDPLASYDVNDRDEDPTPRNDGNNKHGTRCAGEVAAEAGNNWCGVGIAFDCKIGGVRLLDGRISDNVEATSLSHHQNHIDIYSASWGPDDDGKTLDGPGLLAKRAFYQGATEGRGGKGNIFIWASGNGGAYHDSCSFDGYTTSIYTLAISSTDFHNRPPWYLERCPATLATTYSSGSINEPAVVTTDMPDACTSGQTGTSASAPMAAGLVALALEANPNLTWRDVQHLVIRTSDPTPLLANPGWTTNAVKRRVSNAFGYGLMNAMSLVEEAKDWKTVPPQHSCEYISPITRSNSKRLTGPVFHNFTVVVNACSELGSPIHYLEHVQVRLQVKLNRRGALKVTLVSPMGTRSDLLEGRSRDSVHSMADFDRWPLLSVQFWGENPVGTWSLLVDIHDKHNRQFDGIFYGWTLMLFGTQTPAQPSDPPHNAKTGVAEEGMSSQLKSAAHPTPVVFPTAVPSPRRPYFPSDYYRNRPSSAPSSFPLLPRKDSLVFTIQGGYNCLTLLLSLSFTVVNYIFPVLCYLGA